LFSIKREGLIYQERKNIVSFERFRWEGERTGGEGGVLGAGVDFWAGILSEEVNEYEGRRTRGSVWFGSFCLLER
jgi:hypothetical protein